MIKILTEGHAEDFQNLIIEAYKNEPITFLHEFHYGDHLNLTDLENLLHPNNHNNNLVFGAFSNQKLIGIIELDFLPHPSKRHKAYIQSLYVTPQYRGQSISYKLIDALIQYARCHKVEQLILSIASNNIPARVFFNNLGFETFATEEAARKVDDQYIEEHWLIYVIGDSK
ncbi:GNAT family N-acetyltransferase [Staphylococcus canis]|uniref:GNAT family N-acetyltransferase n=1 Tax=Staphylococcus canis TaxID=2724942 RepID=A0ABS0T5S6_9STAP|nr:GNAT family N-acetyltransferase [Staphylococcus canis]MBI5974095.1 GNAT family N-acetyltransferase [Staphylococcus canis]